MAVKTATKPRPPKEAPEPQGMRLTVNRAELLRALGHATAIVERRNTIPVLSNVLIEAADGKVRLTATNLNMQVAINVPANVEAEGSTTVQAALLHGIVREFDDGSQVELSLGDGRLQVVSGRSRYRLQVLPADQFPVVKSEVVNAFSVVAADVVRALGRVAFAQDTDTVVRPHFCGVNVEVHGGELLFVATDGKRLAWSQIEAPKDVEIESAILSTKLVSTMTKLLDDHEGDVSFSFGERKVAVDLGDIILICKLLEGTYPPWRRILPSGDSKRLLIAASSLEAAVRRASLVSIERTRAVKFDLLTDKLTVSCDAQDGGSATEEAPCVWDDGEFAAGFNSRHLLDLLAASGADEMQVDFHEGAQPTAAFTNPNDDNSHWLLGQMRV